jgi:protein-L-isoaspartate(D-aspartate) O-methyltransferase
MQLDFERARTEMVANQLQARGIRAPNVLEAMRSVPREMFLPLSLQKLAYEDAAIPIDEDWTVPQPYLVALMAEALSLDAHAKVLEIGTGSGYATAVLARLAAKVYSVESSAVLAAKAAAALQELQYPHVRIVHADARLGLPNHGPFDAIFVNPGGAKLVGALKAQLALGGRMVLPAGAWSYPRAPTRPFRNSFG